MTRSTGQRILWTPPGLAPETCTLDWCDRPHEGRGYCKSHLHRAKIGRPLEPPIIAKTHASVDERFDAKVDRSGGPDVCWPWTARIDDQGYGQIRVRTGKQTSAHRFAWERANGPVPESLVLDHICHPIDGTCPGGPACLHRRCCNPAHLEPKTRGDNSRRAVRRRR